MLPQHDRPLKAASLKCDITNQACNTQLVYSAMSAIDSFWSALNDFAQVNKHIIWHNVNCVLISFNGRFLLIRQSVKTELNE